MTENKKRINVAIPIELYSKVTESEFGLTEGIIKGLELLLDPKEENNNEISQDVLNLQDSRINELKDQIQALYNQLHVKDDQLHTKDEQIEKLNENMTKQAFHIQSLIQENSRLNIKLLPEVTETKKPWWKFW